ncbi:unnamed protein product [Cylicocyclus nassatus]|uniref:Major facilitator superfamily (MFS) profile domain-containing protein n=1 Tax=Cylicocyclus nassatus TaxID=53992 RepID=A0AA36GI63_CYLNA|nr:unnamed protein product [Cylicocyclus nassatus]
MASKDEEAEQQKLCEPFEEEKQVRNLDEFITLGWYCTLVLFSAEFMTLTSLSSMVYMVYAGISPTVTGCGSVVFNSSAEACENLSALRKAFNCEPVIEYQFKSVNVEFDLLCGESYLVKYSISLQMIGVLFGALISGQLSDRYGRKKVLIVSLIGVSFFSLATAFVFNFLQFTVLRVLVGLFTGGLSAVQGVYLIENIPKRHRMWINTIVTWSPNFIIYPPIVYFCHDWRILSLFTAFISFVATVNMLFLNESPRWLIQHGKFDRARKVLAHMRKMDGKTCEKEAEDIEAMLVHEQDMFEQKQQKRKNYNFYHLVSTWKYFKWTVTVSLAVITASLVNYGLLFNMEKLSGSLYWNNANFGAIRWAVNIFVGVSDYFCKFVGRKVINMGAMILIMAALAIVCILYSQDLQKEEAWVIRYCTIGVTAMTSQLYIATFMITSELFPTAVRNIAVSALSVASRVGTIFAPQLFYLAEIWPVLPYLLLLVLSFLDCVCFQVFLPETKGTNLENHMPAKKKRILNRKQSILEE